jgi:hypothetical protein
MALAPFAMVYLNHYLKSKEREPEAKPKPKQETIYHHKWDDE